MGHELQFYIDGGWVEPFTTTTLEVIDPATEEAFTRIAVGTPTDVDHAVQAARRAFPEFSRTSQTERLALLRRILDAYNARYEDIAQAVSREMGAPIAFAREAQAYAGQAHLMATIEALEAYEFEHQRGSTRIVHDAIGVVGMITPWNWPLNQIVCKVAPALAAGCTMVLKPSEIAPLSGILFAEILDAAGVPKGGFNLVNGTGPDVGQAISSHPDVDMISFTGSTRAGVNVAKLAADTVKRVSQELGGKSANIILPDADLDSAVRTGVSSCFANSGQSCDAPTRMLVPRDRHAEVLQIAKAVAEETIVGDPQAADSALGPVISRVQFDKIQRLIEAGIAEGAELVAGGTGRPAGLNRGYFVKPTVFGNVTPDMTVAREEIFGPVLVIMPYSDEEEAIRIANDTPYGLAAYVQSADLDRARRVGRQLRAGTINLNYPDWDLHAPFGGYKQSGNGREYGAFGIAEFLETKGIVGFGH
ncbi:aldehyde dehydrogenase family protein [Mesorhizobium sp. KR1-2]|uniref:aldehyde dehydrogenase family protein n=1 Tax=Mesorhizobium sp. KR1-2 TaxID=3156609 RepID=UPI0032B53618